MKLGCCIDILFTDLPFPQRVFAAAQTGFDGVEFWGWENKDLKALRDAAKGADLPITVCCVGTKDPARSARYSAGGMLVMENKDLYADMVKETIEAVAPLGIRTLIATTGQTLEGHDRKEQEDAVVACLEAAVPVLSQHHFMIVLEPLNVLVDHKGYYLETSRQAFHILQRVGAPEVKLLYDIYHQQITEGNLIDTITKNIDLIGHFHIADVPGRHEPGTGEIHYKNVIAAIDAKGYNGWLGCEYSPSAGKSVPESAQEILSIFHSTS